MLDSAKASKATDDHTKKRKPTGLLFSSKKPTVAKRKKNFNEQVMAQVIKYFAAEDFNTLENYLNLCDEAALKIFFQEEGYQILEVARFKPNTSAINFIAERIPADLGRAAVRSKNYKALRDYFSGASRVEEEKGEADEKQKQKRRDFFKVCLKLDKEGVTKLFNSPEPPKEIATLAPIVKNDFESVFKSMGDERPKVKATV